MYSRHSVITVTVHNVIEMKTTRSRLGSLIITGSYNIMAATKGL